MASDPENVRDEEIETTEQAEAALSGTGDTGAMMDVADSGALDQSDVPAPSGASDTGVMMDSRDTGALDQSDARPQRRQRHRRHDGLPRHRRPRPDRTSWFPGDGDADESDRQQRPPDPGGALVRCVGDPGRFAAAHWGRAPGCIGRGGRERVRRPVLPRRRRPHPVLDHALLAGLPPGQGGPARPSVLHPGGAVGGQPVDDLADPRRVYELFGAAPRSCSRACTASGRRWPASAATDTALTHPVQVNAYVTPPAAQGWGCTTTPTTCSCSRCTGASAGRSATPDGRPGERLLGAELASSRALHPPAVPARGPDGRDRLGPPDRRGGRHHLGDVARRAVTPAVEGALFGEPLPAGYAADPPPSPPARPSSWPRSGGGWTSSTRPRSPRPPPTGSGPASRRCWPGSSRSCWPWRRSATTSRSGAGLGPCAGCGGARTGSRSCSATGRC